MQGMTDATADYPASDEAEVHLLHIQGAKSAEPAVVGQRISWQSPAGTIDNRDESAANQSRQGRKKDSWLADSSVDAKIPPHLPRIPHPVGASSPERFLPQVPALRRSVRCKPAAMKLRR